ncbi:hypothetical protein ACFFQW_04410 [Umezawaea endophytica]|uniref:Uncharacterized protein n=1 Tax=Umezawaea endophytica TaxID=1654476 RepID=A0A9X2VGU0_9PSEU|nr:hypothetical protein [Umezawaea endophytica]MCS7476388.1 hypothetical protein [Umezawaea endophytica]
MTARRTNVGQFDLFADAPEVTPAPAVERGTPAGYGGQPDVLVLVLDDIHDGKYGEIDPTGRVVRLDGDGHCRHADDDVTTIVEHLVSQRFAEQGEFTSQLQGVIRRKVYKFKLTTAGRKIRTRWFHLRGVR